MSDMDTEDRYIRLDDGTIYGYSELLLRRRDATVVDGYAAAMWFKGQGITNELTEKYPNAPAKPMAKPTTATQRRTNRNEARAFAKAALAEKRAERADKIRRMKDRLKKGPAEQQGELFDGEDSSARQV